jgi:hypothetical protein
MGIIYKVVPPERGGQKPQRGKDPLPSSLVNLMKAFFARRRSALASMVTLPGQLRWALEFILLQGASRALKA